MAAAEPSTGAVTLELARRACAMGEQPLPADIVTLSRACVLDTLGAAIVGADTMQAAVVAEELELAGGTPVATVVGRPGLLPPTAAAMANATAAHALDLDDVHMAVPGHLSAVLVPALLALAQERRARGETLLAAFVAGFETGCRVGALVAPAHYAGGYHATGTVGVIAAAAGCSRLLGLDAHVTAHAIGIAATQASGLKAMAGTMGKPLHAGRAAADGLLAARLAARGFRSRDDALECQGGFADTLGAGCDVAAAFAEPPGGYHLRQNVFKYHAACMLTHSTIDAVLDLRRRYGLVAENVETMAVTVDPLAAGICIHPAPRTGLEGKFSIPFSAALAMLGYDTTQPEGFSDALVADPVVRNLRERIQVAYVPGETATLATVAVRRCDGGWVESTTDAGRPAPDADAALERVRAKFHALVDPRCGRDNAKAITTLTDRLDRVGADEVGAALHRVRTGRLAAAARA